MRPGLGAEQRAAWASTRGGAAKCKDSGVLHIKVISSTVLSANDHGGHIEAADVLLLDHSCIPG